MHRRGDGTGRFQLLADGRLGDAEGVRDVTLAGTGRDQGAQRQRSPEAGEVLLVERLLVLDNQTHKASLSRRASSGEDAEGDGDVVAVVEVLGVGLW